MNLSSGATTAIHWKPCSKSVRAARESLSLAERESQEKGMMSSLPLQSALQLPIPRYPASPSQHQEPHALETPTRSSLHAIIFHPISTFNLHLPIRSLKSRNLPTIQPASDLRFLFFRLLLLFLLILFLLNPSTQRLSLSCKMRLQRL